MPFLGGLVRHDANGSVADAVVATSFRIVKLSLGDKGHPLCWFGWPGPRRS
jgi:hypothetical protein